MLPVFRVLINLGLKLVGADYSQEAIDNELDFIESFFGEHVSRQYSSVGSEGVSLPFAGVPLRWPERHLQSL